MQIFLDSADLNEIQELISYGVIDGLTTNPSLIAKTVTDFNNSTARICQMVPGDVSIEVVSNDFENMLIEGARILSIADNAVIKLPVTWDGIKACSHFTRQGAKVNMTLCFSANQALIAAKAGATYISPFVGRLDDIGQDGMALIKDIRQIYNNYRIPTKILAASIRSPAHVYQSALAGADVATMPAKVIRQLLDHPLTSKGLKIFNSDWASSNLSI